MSCPLPADLEALAERVADLVVSRLDGRVVGRPGRDLANEAEGFLLASGPATAPEVARALRKRRTTIEEVLAADPGRFTRVPPPRGRSGRAKTWAAVVQRGGRVGTSTARDGGGES